MHYLITGGGGFIGSHLIDNLVARGDMVTVLDNFTTGTMANLSHHDSESSISVTNCSILDVNMVREKVAEVDRVIHLAAAVGVFNIVNFPIESMITNIRGTEVILEACLEFNRPLLLTSSSEIYGKNTSAKLSEDSDRIVGAPQKVRWSYSDSKAIDESMAIALHHQRGLEVRIVRLFNTVGPRQVGQYGMVVPRFVSAALKNEPLTIYGSGNQTRCFGHISDIVSGILLVEKCVAAIGKPVNIGSDQEISILDLAQLTIKLLASKSIITFHEYDDVYSLGFEDMERRVPDVNLIHSLVGWAPKLDISRIILDMAQHIRSKEL